MQHSSTFQLFIPKNGDDDLNVDIFLAFLGVVVLPCVSRTMASHAPCCCRPGAAGASDHLRGIGTAVVREIPGGISCWAGKSAGNSKSWGNHMGNPSYYSC